MRARTAEQPAVVKGSAASAPLQGLIPAQVVEEQQQVAQHPSLSVTMGRQRQSWTNGGQIPLDTPIVTLKNVMLVRALAHHQLEMNIPADWWINLSTGLTTACKVRASRSYNSKGYHYLECEIIEPAHALQSEALMEISASKRGL